MHMQRYNILRPSYPAVPSGLENTRRGRRLSKNFREFKKSKSMVNKYENAGYGSVLDTQLVLKLH